MDDIESDTDSTYDMPAPKSKQMPTPARDSPVSSCDDSQNVIYPRRKAGQSKKSGGKTGVVVTLEVLEQVFDMPLHRACKTLGVCATAFKKVCRKLGVMKWPYKDNHLPPKRKAASRRRQLAQERAAAAAAARAAARAAAEAAQSDASTEAADGTEQEPETPKGAHVKVEEETAAAQQDLTAEDEDEDQNQEMGEDQEDEEEVATPEEMLGLYNDDKDDEDVELMTEDPLNFFCAEQPPMILKPEHRAWTAVDARSQIVAGAGWYASSFNSYQEAEQQGGNLEELFSMRDVWQNATAPSMGEILGC